jgi:hypothetical protein
VAAIPLTSCGAITYALVLVDTHAHYMREEDYPIGFSRDVAHEILAHVGEGWG